MGTLLIPFAKTYRLKQFSDFPGIYVDLTCDQLYLVEIFVILWYYYNMKNINVRIIDENTLELAQDGVKGDQIDLKKLHECDIDKSQLSAVLQKKMDKEKQSAIEQERERLESEQEKVVENALLKQEKELKDKYLEQNRGLEKKVAELTAEKQSADKEQESKLALALAEKDKEFETDKAKLEKDIEFEKFKTTNMEESKNQEIEKIKAQNERDLANKDSFHNQQIKILEDERDRWKEHLHSLSTKDFGNSLEEYCDTEFESMTWLPADTTFKPDTTAESKGDRVYREVDCDGKEVLTIMFEMKEERADTKEKNKGKNKDWFSKLDKNRKNQKCEYAVLVSLLEPDNKNYDAPFVVREYVKMFVIRPQHFKYIIENFRLIKGELSYANMQLAEVKKQDIDFTNFQQNWNEYLADIGYNIKLASTHFATLRKQLEKERDDKQKQIDELDAVGKNLDIALRKGNKVDFQKMAKDSPTLLLQFAEETNENAKSKKKS